MKREESVLIGYKLLYDRSGKLVTERISTDITKLKPFFSEKEYAILKTIIREGTVKLDEIHNHIEANLNARVMTN
tara:strand:- start:264 stop:488 length:225 start_codon:yes stop_codon:yes gene_type:complete